MALISNCIAQWASRHPEKPAVISIGDESLTYLQLHELSQCIAANLARHLEKSGTSLLVSQAQPTVMLLSVDDPVSVATVLACNTLGLTVAPINPAISIQALKSARKAINASIILYSNLYREESLELETTQCDAIDILSLTDQREVLRYVKEIDPEYPYLLSLSSGSTGNPKPVIYTDSGKIQRALSTAVEFKFNQDDIILCASPFYHSLGQRLTFMPLALGATMVQLPRFSATAWLDAVAQQRVTVTICVSSHLFALKQHLIDKDPRADSIRALVSSSASIDTTTKWALFDSGHFDFYEMYGASEVATATCLSGADPTEKRNSVGKACRGVEIRVVDEKHQNFAHNQSGEIAIKSPLCTPGYFNRPDLDDKAFHDGWFFTGDLGRIDEDGYLYFIDRCADIINSGGSNIYPSDVEASLRDHPRVRDCLVVGVGDSYLGEAVVAVVMADDSGKVNLERDLRRHVRSSLAPSQQPLMYFLVDEFPLNGAGKIDRKQVRAYYNGLGLDPSARFRDALLVTSSK